MLPAKVSNVVNLLGVVRLVSAGTQRRDHSAQRRRYLGRREVAGESAPAP